MVGEGYKPSSVLPDKSVSGGHLSSSAVADRVQRPTWGYGVERPSPNVWPCSGGGLPGPDGLPAAGELLPHHFTLAPLYGGGMFLWHFP